MRIASRLARLGVVAACLVALVAAPNQPVRADTTASITFTGTMTLGAGYDLPCIPTNTLLPCPGVDLVGREVCDLPLNPPDFPSDLNCHPDYGHNRTSVAVSSTTCVGTFTAFNKPDKPQIEHAGGCSFGSIADPKNTITGWCGRSGGQIVVGFVDPLGQFYILDLHFRTNTGLVFTGHWWKHFRGNTANHGKVVGESTARAPTPFETTSESCTNKSARNFGLDGTVTLVPSPTL